MTKITYIPGEIANAAIDERGNRKPVTRTHHIFDNNKNKNQAEINVDIDKSLNQLSNEIDAVNKQDVISVDTLPDVTTADPKKIYRVVGDNNYTDYMVNSSGDNWKKLATYSFPGIDNEPTAGSDNLVKSDGVFSSINTIELNINRNAVANKIADICGFTVLDAENNKNVYTDSAITNTGKISYLKGKFVIEYNVTEGEVVAISGYVPGNNQFAGYVFKDDNDNVIYIYSTGVREHIKNRLVEVPKGATIIQIYSEVESDIVLYRAFAKMREVINVDSIAPLSEGYHTFESAVSSVPIKFRKRGSIITYKTADGRNMELMQFTGKIYNDSAWVSESNWLRYANQNWVNKSLVSINNSLVSINESIVSTKELDIINPSNTGEGYVVYGNIGTTVKFGDFSNHTVYNIPAGTRVRIKNKTGGLYGFALCDSNNIIVESYISTETSSYIFDVYEKDLILYASTVKLLSVNSVEFIPINDKVESINDKVKSINDKVESGNYWMNKTIWWCGTSIPAGSDSTLGSSETVAGNYPTQVGNNLNATVINKAVGGSMCRANVRTGDYNGANFSNITSCLSMTKEEIENFISNYDSIKSKLTGGAPDSLNEKYLNRLRSASFEDRLLPYLNGTYPMPSLFVLDHGHNDFKYKLSNGKSDIGLEPTTDNITSGELAEDTYMTSGNNAKLESFFGDLSNIPSIKKEEFIASLNRNCYIGAMNFIITLILRYNPHARIIFISNYEYENGVGTSYTPLIPAQETLSKSWAFPLCKVWEYLGYSNHIIPSSKDWFNNKYPNVVKATTDITVYRAYLPDGVHPHSDITGDANKVYAGIISEFIKKYR